MKGIRRFQRTMFTLLLGINVFVLTQSLKGDVMLALYYSTTTVVVTAIILIGFSFMNRSISSKKRQESISPSAEN
ncbi:MAG: hypothetical protein N4A41_03625 [Crocinitomicaceae bacterium]|jgi:hypothetical protein|nr:hypothetical protein [Crocinitomicaceae bacterium]